MAGIFFHVPRTTSPSNSAFATFDSSSCFHRNMYSTRLIPRADQFINPIEIKMNATIMRIHDDEKNGRVPFPS